MDLEHIAASTSLPIRRLRYVLDHRVLPGAERRSKGHRVTRHFTPFEAFGIACAAALLDLGLRRPVVANVFRWLTRGTPRGIPLLSAFEGRGEFLEVADGVNLRILSTGKDPDWVQAATGTALRNYQPLATVRLDVGRLRRTILKAQPEQ